jgi:hypothetical protein
MTDRPVLSEEEWALVTELLAIEHSELPVEIHHCRSMAMRAELHQRLKMVDDLRERLRQPVGI